MKTINKELIKELTTVITKIINDAVKDVEPKEKSIPIGTWMYSSSNKENYVLYRYYGTNEYGNHATNEGYHIIDKTLYSDASVSDSFSKGTIATNEQIEKVLIAVAKVKGFVDGVTFTHPEMDIIGLLKGLYYNEVHDSLYSNGNPIYNGIYLEHNHPCTWATIVKEHKLQHKQLIWAWDYGYTHGKHLLFYDAINNCCFSHMGKNNGSYYDNYLPYEGEYPKWAIEAQNTLQD